MKKRFLLKVFAVNVALISVLSLFGGCADNEESDAESILNNWKASTQPADNGFDYAKTVSVRNRTPAQNQTPAVQTPIADNSESEKLEEIVDKAVGLGNDVLLYSDPSGSTYKEKSILYTYLGIDGCYTGEMVNNIPNGYGYVADSYHYTADTLFPGESMGDINFVAIGTFKDGHLIGDIYIITTAVNIQDIYQMINRTDWANL